MSHKRCRKNHSGWHHLSGPHSCRCSLKVQKRSHKSLCCIAAQWSKPFRRFHSGCCWFADRHKRRHRAKVPQNKRIGHFGRWFLWGRHFRRLHNGWDHCLWWCICRHIGLFRWGRRTVLVDIKDRYHRHSHKFHSLFGFGWCRGIGQNKERVLRGKRMCHLCRSVRWHTRFHKFRSWRDLSCLLRKSRYKRGFQPHRCRRRFGKFGQHRRFFRIARSVGCLFGGRYKPHCIGVGLLGKLLWVFRALTRQKVLVRHRFLVVLFLLGWLLVRAFLPTFQTFVLWAFRPFFLPRERLVRKIVERLTRQNKQQTIHSFVFPA